MHTELPIGRFLKSTSLGGNIVISAIIRLRCKLVRRINLAFLGFVLVAGCGDATTSEPKPPLGSNTVLRGMPDFTLRPGDIPNTDDVDHAGPMFRIRINSVGEIYRNDQLTTKADVVAELLAIPDISDVAVEIEGDPDVRVSMVIELQSYLSHSVPGLKSVTNVVVREQSGE
jgi:hypothetical protein